MYRWKISSEVLVAFTTLILMSIVYYAQFNYIGHLNSFWGSLLFIIGGNIVLSVLFPLFYIAKIRQHSISELGITTQFWKTSLLVSLVISLFTWPNLLITFSYHSWHENLKQVLFNSLLLWEPFFVYGWLQLCYERAFGTVPAVILAALSFGLYHIGSLHWLMVLSLIGYGLVFGIIFNFTRNLLIIWPLAWGVNSALATTRAQIMFNWHDIFIYAIVLALQLALIFYFWKSEHSPTTAAQ